MSIAQIPADDRGFALGDGLFETVLAENGELRRLADHLERMTAGCAVLDLPPPDPRQAETAMLTALAEANLRRGRAAVRLTLTAGSGGRGLDRPTGLSPRLVATAAAAAKPVEPARLILSKVRRNERSPASRIKSLAYLDNVLARNEARAAGADEALMRNVRGEIACAAAANVFWIEAGRIFTPSLDCGVLDGITRRRVFAAAEALELDCDEVRADKGDLMRAEAMFLSNSLIGLRPVASWDGRVLGTWSRLAELEAALP